MDSADGSCESMHEGALLEMKKDREVKRVPLTESRQKQEELEPIENEYDYHKYWKDMYEKEHKLRQEAQGETTIVKGIGMTEEHRTLNSEHQKSLSYEFSYWGPMLFKIKLPSHDLKKCAQLCNKKSSFVNDALAGVIKHQHYISSQKFCDIIDPYLTSFRHCFQQWYGKPLHNKIMMTAAWVNFMTAGEFNPPHIHEDCDFSSVLFIKIPEKLKEENKKFLGSGGGPGCISFTYGESQLYSISRKEVFPEEGDLFIFPATLTHFVAPFMCKEERISISANLKFK